MFNLKGLNTGRGLNTWSGITWNRFKEGYVSKTLNQLPEAKSITRRLRESHTIFYFCFLATPFSQPGIKPTPVAVEEES